MKRLAAAASVLIALGGAAFAEGKKDGVAGKRTDVRWFVGLGAGSDAPTLDAQKKVVEAFNASQSEINLILEVVDNAEASNALAVRITAGNPPDIVGPVGIEGRDSFRGTWLDLAPLVKKHGFDLSKYSKEILEFYNDEKEGMLGIPFAVYPSFLYVNKKLFDEAGIPYPPQKLGEKYVDENGKAKAWDMQALREVAMKLTIDKNGLDATEKGFDPDSIVQFGFGTQWFSPKQFGTLYGGGSLKTADDKPVVPANWLECWTFFHDAMWKDYWHPNGPYMNSDTFGQGDLFASGNVAMVQSHLWYAGFMEVAFPWDTAVLPAHKGKVTAALNADTFEIPKTSKNHDAAFKAMAYLLNEGCLELTTIYGGMPARKDLQAKFLENFAAARFPGQKIEWSVVSSHLDLADKPSYESWLPNYLETETRLGTFWDRFLNEKDFDVAKEAKILVKDLEPIYAASK